MAITLVKLHHQVEMVEETLNRKEYVGSMQENRKLKSTSATIIRNGRLGAIAAAIIVA